MADGETGRVTVADVHDHVAHTLPPATNVASWSGACRHDGVGTAFILVLTPAVLAVEHGTHSLAANSYAVVTDPANVTGGCGVIITTRDHDGLFHVGGPVEPTGRLQYIDGCRDTVLVAPVVRGDPCVNLLQLPPCTLQSEHLHPSVRVGLVVDGQGVCVAAGARHDLRRGSVFVLSPCAPHRFETGASGGLLLMAWHPDSDHGPTDDDHPMLNRTLRPGSGRRVR